MSKKNGFLSGTLNTIILSLLKENSKMYGYEICVKAKEISNEQIVLTEGAMYPALHKLEKKGLIKSSKQVVNGRMRKYYSLSQNHVKEIDNEIQTLFNFTEVLQSILKPSL